MGDQTIVRLKISSLHRTPEQISEATGLACDRSWRIGDTRGKTTIIEKTNGWVINSALPKRESLNVHMEDLLTRLAPFADRIRMLSDEDGVEFSCVIYASTPPALHFDRKVVEQIQQLGASLDVDLYLDEGKGA